MNLTGSFAYLFLIKSNAYKLQSAVPSPTYCVQKPMMCSGFHPHPILPIQKSSIEPRHSLIKNCRPAGRILSAISSAPMMNPIHLLGCWLKSYLWEHWHEFMKTLPATSFGRRLQSTSGCRYPFSYHGWPSLLWRVTPAVIMPVCGTALCLYVP